jgi:uncharacterized protein (TIGR03086 family)
MMDATTMAAACESTRRVVEQITDADLDQPTPSRDWTVRQLLNHLIGTLQLGRALLEDTTPEVAMGPGGLPEVDLLGGDPVKAYRLGVDGLLAAARPDTLTRMHATPLGDMPGAILSGFTTLDIAVHGWDLGAAIGRPVELDDTLASAVLAFAEQTISDDTRAPRIGPEVAVAATAPVTDRLVAYLGRTP